MSYVNNQVTISDKNKTFSTEVSNLDKSQQGLINQKSIVVLKAQVEEMTKILINNAIKNNYASTINSDYKGNYFFIQIYEDSEQQRIINEKTQKENNLSIIILDQCALDLKKYYDLQKDILIGKIDWDPKLSAKRNFGDVTLKYYNPNNGEEITEDTYKDICSNRTLIIKYPLNNIPIDNFEYEKYINKTFNIYDAQSDFYNSRCTPLRNDTSKGDITMNRRLDFIYRNLTLSCGDFCKFTKLEDNYIHCKCRDLEKQKNKAFIRDLGLSPYSVLNLGIIACAGVITLVKEIFL